MFVVIYWLGLNLHLCLFVFYNVWICCELRTNPSINSVWNEQPLFDGLLYMKTRCDNKGSALSKASLFDLYSREDHAAVGDPPDKKKGLQPLTVLSSHREQVVFSSLQSLVPSWRKISVVTPLGTIRNCWWSCCRYRTLKKKKPAAPLFLDNEGLWWCC